MTSSVYLIGGAGTGKSTFMGQLLAEMGEPMSDLKDLYTKANSRGTVITLRGHRLGKDGLYLGCMRESFPGTDGLDRVSYIPGEEWLTEGHHAAWRAIVGEGATLAVRRFIYPLVEKTDCLLVHLVADDFVKELRFLERGSDQDPKFVTATATRSANLFRDAGGGLEVDTADPTAWADALDACVRHLS